MTMIKHNHSDKIGRGEKGPHPYTLALVVRNNPVLLRADFVLAKDLNWPYEGHLCGKMKGMGPVVKQPGGPE